MLPEGGSNVKDAPVTRHIDALGCIHIPEDIRKSLGLRTNDELEFCAAEGGILIKKCDEVKNIEDFRDSLVKAKCFVEKAEIWYGHNTTAEDMDIVCKLIDVENLLTYVLSLTETFE
jgi:AbrB family looped-hinge helix DNA binding protein